MKQKIFLTSLSAIAAVTTTISFIPNNSKNISSITKESNDLQDDTTTNNSTDSQTESATNIYLNGLKDNSSDTSGLSSTSNSFTGNVKDQGLDFATYKMVGDTYRRTDYGTNLNFSYNVTSKPIVKDNLDSSNIKNEIINNSQYSMSFNNWGQNKNNTTTISDRDMKNYFSANNIKLENNKTSSLYTINNYSYDLGTKTNINNSDGSYIDTKTIVEDSTPNNQKSTSATGSLNQKDYTWNSTNKHKMGYHNGFVNGNYYYTSIQELNSEDVRANSQKYWTSGWWDLYTMNISDFPEVKPIVDLAKKIVAGDQYHKLGSTSLKSSSTTDSFLSSFGRKIDNNIWRRIAEKGIYYVYAENFIGNHFGTEGYYYVNYIVVPTDINNLENNWDYLLWAKGGSSNDNLYVLSIFDFSDTNNRSPWKFGNESTYYASFTLTANYSQTSMDESIVLSNYKTIENSKINNINEFQVISNVALDRYLKLDLDSSNAYSNNGSVWTDTPSLKFTFNDDILEPAYQLYKLKHLYNDVVDKCLDTSIPTSKRVSLLNLKTNIENLTETYYQFQKAYDDLVNNGVNINLDSAKKCDLFEKYNDNYQAISSNIDEWDNDWKIFCSVFTNKTITANYSTPLKTNQNVVIWDGKQFNPIVANDLTAQNNNYISIQGLTYDVDNAGSRKTISLSSIAYDNKTFNNVTESPSNIKYSFLYRKSALNHSDLEISSRSADYYSIQIPIDKYVSDVVKANNGFVNPTGAEVTNALNKVFKVDSGTSDFVYTTIPIGETSNISIYTNWTKALDYFGLSYDTTTGVPKFKRDDSNGIFYGVISVPNWKFSSDDDNSIATGDYSKAFVDKIKKNKDIFELNPISSSNTSGYFLVKMKTTKTSTKLNANYDYETWTPNSSTNSNINTDQRNPLALFNTKTNQDALSNAINYVKTPSNFNIVKTQTTNKDDANKIDVTTNYTLKDNATVELSLDKFGGTFTQDYKLYEDGLVFGWNRDTYPTIEQDFYEKIWNSSWNESNNDTNTGLIVNRTKKMNGNEFYYEYSLNSNYKLAKKNVNSIDATTGTRKYEAYLVNANDDSKFTINSNVNKILSMFEDRYVKHAENSALTTQFKQNYQTSYTTTETENKPEEKPDNNNNSNGNDNNNNNNNNSNGGNSIDPTVKKNNSVSSTTLGLSIGLPLLGAIILGLLCFIIIMRKNQKRLTNGFTKEEADKSSKGDK